MLYSYHKDLLNNKTLYAQFLLTNFPGLKLTGEHIPQAEKKNNILQKIYWSLIFIFVFYIGNRAYTQKFKIQNLFYGINGIKYVTFDSLDQIF